MAQLRGAQVTWLMELTISLCARVVAVIPMCMSSLLPMVLICMSFVALGAVAGTAAGLDLCP